MVLRVPPVTLRIPASEGPPTESRIAVEQNLAPDRDAHILDPTDLRSDCKALYPSVLASERATGQTIELRVFVMPDGRIGQGTITHSSGDENLDLLTLRCLQAYSHLDTVLDDDLSTGSWQKITWNWGEP
ncbi:MAG: hypothetical protein JSR66_31415 [Proteobacteria bacterium]|nr:hypothetical protein [Pseudomonadota bacterium]